MSVSIDDAYKALTTISEICKGSAGCKSCPFQTCGIIEQGYLAYWSIKKPKIELFD